MREFMNVSKALADANRVRIVLVLRKGELCACQLTELFGLASSTMSKHLSILYQARLANMRCCSPRSSTPIRNITFILVAIVPASAVRGRRSC